MADKQYEKIDKIVIELTTCSEKRKSSTDDPVILYTGGHEWDLDKPHYDDFERGKTDSYNLDVPAGMDSSYFRYLCFKKRTRTAKGDDWCLDKIKLTINDKVVYEKDSLNAWLKGEKTSFCAPDFKYGQAGE
ncbi:MAG: PLAT/LH2 domain-containing protein [Candidatus Heimdallarchaeota archaeon]